MENKTKSKTRTKKAKVKEEIIETKAIEEIKVESVKMTPSKYLVVLSFPQYKFLLDNYTVIDDEIVCDTFADENKAKAKILMLAEKGLCAEIRTVY